MKSLSNLKLVALKRPQTQPPIVYKREKLLTGIREQINVAQAYSAGTTYSKTTKGKLKNRETGEIKVLEVLRYPRPWWWTGEDGKQYLTLKYGNRALELQEGKFAFQLSANADIGETLKKIAQAVEAGEFDSVLEKLSYNQELKGKSVATASN